MSPALDQMALERRRSLRWMDQASSTGMVAGVLAVVVAVVALFIAVGAAWSGQGLAQSWHRNLSLALWFTLLPIPGAAWSVLQAQRRVWVSRVAPAQAVRSVTRAFWLTQGLAVAVTVLPLSAVACLVPPPGGIAAAVLLVLGLVGGTVSATVIASAAWRGHLPGLWLLPALAVLLGFGLGVFPAAHWPAWQAGEGFRAAVLVVLAAMPAGAAALLWPMLDVRSAGRIRGQGGGQGGGLRAGVRQRWRSVTERFRYVDGPSSIGIAAGLWGQLPQQFINGQPEGLLFMPWGSTFTMAGPWRLLLLAALVGSLLSTPALHWRHLLAPGGAVRARLGWTIWLTTLGVVLGLLAIVLVPIGLGWLMLSERGPEVWPRLPGLVLSYLPPLLLDLALVTALATLLRGWAGSQGRALLALGGLALGWGLLQLLVWAYTGQAAPVLLRRDAGFAALMLAAAVGCAWAAARLWSRADLGELLRAGRRTATADDEAWRLRRRPGHR